MKLKFKKENLSLISILISGLLIRLSLYRFWTLDLDQNTFIAWGRNLSEVGFSQFYQAWSDYLPGYLYILRFLAEVEKKLSVDPVLLYKLPAIFADVATGWLIFIILKKYVSVKKAVIGTIFFVFNPAVISNSTFWGQVDSLTSLFSLIALWLLETNIYLSAIFFAVGVLIKPQALFIAPAILYFFYKRKRLGKLFIYGLVTGLVFTACFIPFANGENLPKFIISRLDITLNQYPYTSVNAFNFWGIFGFWKDDREGIISKNLIGYVLTCVSLLGALIWFIKKKQKDLGQRYALAAIAFLVTFEFLTRMHERHLLPILAPLAIASTIKSELWFSYIGLSIIYVLNLMYSYNWISHDYKSIFPDNLTLGFSLLSMTFLVLTILSLSFLKIGKLGNKFEGNMLHGMRVRREKYKFLIGLIMLFALFSRLIFLQEPRHEYFDEVYHAFTARIMLHGDPKAWEWWNPHPEGFAYEWTHPPLAKEGMVLGMLLLGENSLGWRVPEVILGTLTVFLVYLIAKALFEDNLVGVLAMCIYSLDGLPLVMSRIGMNDIYFLFFSLLTFYLFLKKRDFWASLSLGLAFASKWSTLWLLPLLVFSHFVLKKKLSLSYFFYFFIPPLVYLGSYIPMFITGHGFDIFIGVQKQMWWYHTNLEATHPFTSPWWSWPLLLKPVWLDTSGAQNNLIANIYVMGNPLIFWGGIAAVIIFIAWTIKFRDRRGALLVFAYFIFFVPWSFSPRIMFLYHYLPAIPFLAIILAVFLRKVEKLSFIFLSLSGIIFIFFLPHWIGIYVPLWLDKLYYWLPSW
jgi:predicted membrane-bound dolichyl-phosphate-mannose-protein mannosyltransferase